MKRTIHIHWLAAVLLAVAASSAGAQSVGVSAGVEVKRDRAAAAVAEKDDDRVDRHCLRHTGSRITASRTSMRKHGNRCAPAFGRVWTREDLERTGRIDIADALRTLDPSIH